MDAAFQVHRLNPEGMKKAKQIADRFDQLYQYVLALSPQTRETALVRTHMEMACVYAKKSMAMQVENQEPEA